MTLSQMWYLILLHSLYFPIIKCWLCDRSQKEDSATSIKSKLRLLTLFIGYYVQLVECPRKGKWYCKELFGVSLIVNLEGSRRKKASWEPTHAPLEDIWFGKMKGGGKYLKLFFAFSLPGLWVWDLADFLQKYCVLSIASCNQGADSHNSGKESPSCNCRQLRHFITATKYHRHTSSCSQ